MVYTVGLGVGNDWIAHNQSVNQMLLKCMTANDMGTSFRKSFSLLFTIFRHYNVFLNTNLQSFENNNKINWYKWDKCIVNGRIHLTYDLKLTWHSKVFKWTICREWEVSKKLRWLLLPHNWNPAPFLYMLYIKGEV